MDDEMTVGQAKGETLTLAKLEETMRPLLVEKARLDLQLKGLLYRLQSETSEATTPPQSSPSAQPSPTESQETLSPETLPSREGH